MEARAAAESVPWSQAAGSGSPEDRKPGSGVEYVSKKRLGHSYCACPLKPQ
jgi:hypothetical protein